MVSCRRVVHTVTINNNYDHGQLTATLRTLSAADGMCAVSTSRKERCNKIIIKYRKLHCAVGKCPTHDPLSPMEGFPLFSALKSRPPLDKHGHARSCFIAGMLCWHKCHFQFNFEINRTNPPPREHHPNGPRSPSCPRRIAPRDLRHRPTGFVLLGHNGQPLVI